MTRSIPYLKLVLVELLPKTVQRFICNMLFQRGIWKSGFGHLFVAVLSYLKHAFHSNLSLCDIPWTMRCLPLCLPVLGMLRNLDPAGLWTLWEGEGDEGWVNRIFPREGGDLSLGNIEEVRGHQGKRDCN